MEGQQLFECSLILAVHAAEQEEIQRASYNDIFYLIFRVVVLGNENESQLLELSDGLFCHIDAINSHDVLEDKQDAADADLGLRQILIIGDSVVQLHEDFDEDVRHSHCNIKVALHCNCVVVQVERNGFLSSIFEDAGHCLESSDDVLV